MFNNKKVGFLRKIRKQIFKISSFNCQTDLFDSYRKLAHKAYSPSGFKNNHKCFLASKNDETKHEKSQLAFNLVFFYEIFLR